MRSLRWFLLLVPLCSACVPLLSGCGVMRAAGAAVSEGDREHRERYGGLSGGGSSPVVCQKCGGLGKVKCPLCHGAGVFHPKLSSSVKCNRCDAAMYVPCSSCGGSGER
ncbi:MAG: hypothetical protein FD180_3682 [Planctomycetota bacterium]|nr:MAG: hypothetical protein FD180_3682 [Planctomycetota bacterium]